MAKFLGLLLAAPEVTPLLSSELFDGFDGTDDDPPSPSGGNGFGSASAKGRKRARGVIQRSAALQPDPPLQ